MQKKVVITGAGKGIGLELVNRFLIEPDFIVFAITRDISRLSMITSNNLHIIKGDLILDYNYILSQIHSNTTSIDYFVNNAAVVYNSTIENTTDQMLDYLMQVNFHVPYKLIRDLSNTFINGSHIINISSMSGFQGSKKFKGLSLYSPSKAALASLSECVAEEWADREVACNCLALGSVDTDMVKVSIPGLKPRVSSSNMANYIFEFAINGHKFFNGKVIPVALNTF